MLLRSNPQDTSAVNYLNRIAYEYTQLAEYDSSYSYANRAYLKAKQLNYKKGEARAVNIFGLVHMYKNEYPEALTNFYASIRLHQYTNDKVGLANSWHNIGFIYHKKGDYSKALKNYSIALEIRKKNSDLRGIVSSYNNMGMVYTATGNYTAAVNSYSMALNINEELTDERNVASCYSNIGDVYQVQGNYPLALKYYLTALKTFEKNKEKATQAIIYNTIGSMYYSWQKYPEAIAYSDKALKMAEQMDDKWQIASSRNLLGLISMNKGLYEDALRNFSVNLELYKELGDDADIAITLDNMGDVYYHMGRYEEAMKKDSAAHALYTLVGDKQGIAQSLLNIGIIEMLYKKYGIAEAHFLKSLSLAKEMKSRVIIKSASEQLSKLCEATGKRGEALKYYKEYTSAKDSIFNESNIKKIVELEMNYDFDKKEASLKAEQEKKDLKAAEEKKIREFQLIGALAILIVVIAIGWLFIRQNRIRAEQQAMQLEQQLLRSQMNPHFIFNSLIAIESFIYNNEPKAAGKYLSGFARLMRLILENSRKETVTLEKEIESLENYLQLQRLRYDNAFAYTITVSPDLETDFIELPPMLAQPFIENAIEHGLRTITEGGLIEIGFSRKDGNLLLEIKDNGTGIHQKTNSGHQSLATAITKERIALFNKKSKQKASFSIADAYPLQERKGVLVIFVLPVL